MEPAFVWPQIIFGIFLDFFPRPLLTTGKIFNIALCADEMPQLVKISLWQNSLVFGLFMFCVGFFEKKRKSAGRFESVMWW